MWQLSFFRDGKACKGWTVWSTDELHGIAGWRIKCRGRGVHCDHLPLKWIQGMNKEERSEAKVCLGIEEGHRPVDIV
jgi:hypothetical protein